MPDAYIASFIVELLRKHLVKNKISFSFETVMSHPSKISFARRAGEKGFRTYLYFAATEDVQVNVSRIKRRVEKGGHNVIQAKIKERYLRSLGLLLDAIKSFDRVYLFDNSSLEMTFIAEINANKEIILQSELIPNWFDQYVLQKLKP